MRGPVGPGARRLSFPERLLSAIGGGILLACGLFLSFVDAVFLSFRLDYGPFPTRPSSCWGLCPGGTPVPVFLGLVAVLLIPGVAVSTGSAILGRRVPSVFGWGLVASMAGWVTCVVSMWAATVDDGATGWTLGSGAGAVPVSVGEVWFVLAVALFGWFLLAAAPELGEWGHALLFPQEARAEREAMGRRMFDGPHPEPGEAR